MTPHEDLCHSRDNVLKLSNVKEYSTQKVLALTWVAFSETRMLFALNYQWRGGKDLCQGVD